ncbi:MAG: site-2 protease family protein [Clostridia bacterium]|nr:site-2 protease family protein [Clostridia bacterium]
MFAQKDEILIALAGPCVNFILSMLCICLWWLFPSLYNFSYDFVFQSLMLGLFNLLPCYPLDGGRVFVGILSKYVQRKKAVKITVSLNIIIAIFLLSLFVVSCFINFNPSLCLSAVFMILSSIESKNECKYEVMNVFNKKIKNYSKPLFLSVNSSETIAGLIKHIEVNKFTIFLVVFPNDKTKLLDEQAVKALSFKYQLSTRLSDIFMQDRE